MMMMVIVINMTQ